MKYYGKYRAIVVENSPIADKKRLGRIKVKCPKIYGIASSVWAMPCVPYAGPQVGFVMRPPRGAKVWIEFEEGDINKPIWSGCFWGLAEFPLKVKSASQFVIQTRLNTFELNDLKKSAKLQVGPAPTLGMTFDAKGVEVKNNAAKMNLSASDAKLSYNSSSASVKAAAVKLNAQSTVDVSPASVKLKSKAAEALISPSNVEVKNGGAKMNVKSSGINLKNGGSSVDLGSAKVKINKSSLEVS